MLQLLGAPFPQTLCRDFAPGPHWGTPPRSPRPPDLIFPQLHFLDPPLPFVMVIKIFNAAV